MIYSGLKSHPSYENDKRYFEAGSSGLLRFHLAIQHSPAYSALEADRSPFVNAVSFGESHTLMMVGYDGDTIAFSHEKTQQKDRLPFPVVTGFWYRVALGFQTADEVSRCFDGFAEIWLTRIS